MALEKTPLELALEDVVALLNGGTPLLGIDVVALIVEEILRLETGVG